MMRSEIQRWHTLSLAAHNASMHEDLIQPYHIISESIKTYTFENAREEELSPLRGFFALKESGGHRKKYFVEEQYYQELPVRVNSAEEVFFKDNARTKTILLRPTDVTPFRIKPQMIWESTHEFVDLLAPFQHSRPEEWTLAKIIALMGIVGKTFVGICSPSEFGKSSVYLILDAICQQCPVFQPRSVPGVLAQITSTGNMVFDEVHDAPTEVKSCMENFSLQVAGNSPIYINGALKSKNTKSKYDVSQQSITFLYNILSHYSDPTKQFWDNIWSNTKAMQSRFLLMAFDGKLLEEFDKDFDMVKVADENKMFYVNIAKHTSWLRKQKIENALSTRWEEHHKLNLVGRHKIIYDEIVWMIDQYANSQAEKNSYVLLLNKVINNYKLMLGTGSLLFEKANITSPPEEGITAFEQYITTPVKREETSLEKVLAFLKLHSDNIPEDISKETGLSVEEVEDCLKTMAEYGDAYEKSPGRWNII